MQQSPDRVDELDCVQCIGNTHTSKCSDCGRVYRMMLFRADSETLFPSYGGSCSHFFSRLHDFVPLAQQVTQIFQYFKQVFVSGDTYVSDSSLNPL